MLRRRRWVLSGVFVMLAAIGAGFALYHQFTGNVAVRLQILSQLRKHVLGGDVALGTARFRLFGGITVEDFTLYRRDDPTRSPVLQVPAAIIQHDPEQLARGRLAIRKITLKRPRLTLTRNAAGAWNVGGILGPVRPDMPIPNIELEQATIVFELAPPNGSVERGTLSPVRVEVSNVNATLVNHPLPILNLRLHGDAKSLGPLNIQAAWHRVDSRLDADVDFTSIPITTAMVRELGRCSPGFADGIEQASGVCHLTTKLQLRNGATPTLTHQSLIDLKQGRIVHRDLPLPLDRIDLSARCNDGIVTVDRMTAHSGSASVALKCELTSPIECPQPPSTADPIVRASHEFHKGEACVLDRAHLRSLEFTVQRLQLSPEFFDRLPASIQKFQQLYSPIGPVDVTVRLSRDADQWLLSTKIRPLGISGRFEAFPYPLHNARGSVTVTQSLHQPTHVDVDLTAEATGKRPVTIQGRFDGEGAASSYAFTIRGDAISLDEPLISALPSKFQNVVRGYQPQGRCDITCRLSRPAGNAHSNQHYTVAFRGDASVCYDQFPVPLDQLRGTLDIRLGAGAPITHRGNWLCTFTDIRAIAGGAAVQIGGQVQPTETGPRVELLLRGQQVPLDETLANAFARMKVRPIWDMFRPSGRFDFTASVSHTDRHDAPADYDIRVAHSGATIWPTFFPLAFRDLAGSFRLTRGLVEIGHCTARHGPTRFDLGSGAVQHADGSYYADLRSLRANPLPVDSAFVGALPSALQSVSRALEIQGSLAIQIDRLVIDRPPELSASSQPAVLYWDGRVTFQDARLHTGIAWTGVCGEIASRGRYRGQLLDGVVGHIAIDRATVFGQPLVGLHADASVRVDSPTVLRLRNINGRLFNGQLGGEARVAFGAGLQFELDLKALGVQLDEVARHNRIGNSAQLSGLAKAELYLKGNGAGVNDLEGWGNLHVPSGRLYNLPIILDLLKVVTALQAPDGTAFEEAHAEFQIHGPRVHVQRLDLLGNAISLGGRGEMNLDGADLAMEFYAVWGQFTQMLPPGLREVPPWLSKNLLLVKAKGRLGGEVDFRPEPVPMLVEPARLLAERFRTRMQSFGSIIVEPGARGQKY